jgi:hypothetical protein
MLRFLPSLRTDSNLSLSFLSVIGAFPVDDDQNASSASARDVALGSNGASGMCALPERRHGVSDRSRERTVTAVGKPSHRQC